MKYANAAVIPMQVILERESADFSRNEGVLMAVANEFADTLRDVRRLLESDPSSKAELKAWNSEAIALMKRMRSSPAISNAIPEEVWHFLSDADIRLRDSTYARIQRETIDRCLQAFEKEA